MYPARANESRILTPAATEVHVPPVAPDDPRIATRELAIRNYEEARTSWWEAYKRGGVKPEERLRHAELQALKQAAVTKYGDNSEHPDCAYCLEVSVFGGPSHDGSVFCKKRHAHCTCDLCH